MIKKRFCILNLFSILCLFSFFSCKTEVDSTIKNFKITYISTQGDGFNESKTVPEGYKIQKLDLMELSFDGYDFLGWYDHNEKVEVGKKITEDTILIAKWEKRIPTYTVTFESKYGKEPDSIFNVKHDSTLSDDQIPSMNDIEGYNFSGWTVEEVPFNSNYRITSNITVTAT